MPQITGRVTHVDERGWHKYLTLEFTGGDLTLLRRWGDPVTTSIVEVPAELSVEVGDEFEMELRIGGA